MGRPLSRTAIPLSIVIPTYNRHRLLGEVIAAVERQTLDADAFELIVVDNSSDRRAQAAFLDGLSVDCCCEYAVEELPGAARARNIGTRLAKGDIVAFLDDDALAHPCWAESVLARFAAESAIGVLGGPVVPIWPGERPAWLPAWADALLSVLDHGPIARALGPGEHLIGANMALRRTALETAGGFPEHLGRRGLSLLSNEDLAVRRAVAATGLIAFYDPGMCVRHHVHADRLSQDWLRRRMAWQTVSDLIESDGDVTGEGLPSPAYLDRLLSVEASEKEVNALLDECRDPAGVTAQMFAVRMLLRLLLASTPQPPT